MQSERTRENAVPQERLEIGGREDLEAENRRLREELTRLESRLADQTEEREALEERKARLEKENAILREVRQQTLAQLRLMIGSKLGKLSHLLYRVKRQGFHRDAAERRAFRRWAFAHLLHRQTAENDDHRYHPLFSLLDCLNGGERRLRHLWTAVPEEYQRTFPNVFLFASVPFYDVGGGQRSAQLARAFHQMGYRVHYIYAFPSAELAPVDLRIPAITHEPLGEMSVEWFGKMVRPGDLAVFEIPYDRFEPYLELAKERGCHTVYEHIDNWETSLGAAFFDGAVFERFLDRADTLTVTARNLGEKLREHTDRDYLYLANAVNVELFEPARPWNCPRDLRRGRRTLLYFGSLWGEWFDWDILDYVARHCKGVSVNLIGDDAACGEIKKRLPKNVHFLGLKKQTELPAYLKYSDLALLPFKKCDIGRYVSPLKIFEYIAMGVPVLSTSLEDIAGYPNVICGDTGEEWARVVDAPLPRREDTRAFIAQNNWYARCCALLEHSGMLRREYPKISVIVLNHNNGGVIFRCVDTLLACQDRYGYEILVVDNASTDGSPEELERAYRGKIRLLRNGKNGCASGRNLGAAHAAGEYLCFLDSDQWVVSQQWLDVELSILERDPGMGAAGWAAGWFNPGQVSGPISDFYEGRAVLNPSRLYRDDVAYLGTGGLLIRADLLRQMGGFDEAYDPTCFEDTDLSLRLRDAGYRLAYTPYSAILHLPHQTTEAGGTEHRELMRRNGAYFLKKWEERDPALLQCYYRELD